MKKITKLGLAALIAAGSILSASAATIQVTADITTDTTWTSDNEYVLTKLIYVRNAKLTIQPGTIVRGMPENVNTPEFDPGTLIVTRSAQLFAEGTSTNPIIFTKMDDADPKNNPQAPVENGQVNQGFWGGIILLGRAPTNVVLSGNIPGTSTPIPEGTNFIEGIEQTADTLYGGNEPNDNSGVIKYVSIRHSGAKLTGNNEINGLTMGGVGFGTVIDFVEVYCNLDDGYEWFGGTVASRWLVSAYNDDDCFDWDEGYTGLNQFWFGLQGWTGVNFNRGAEMDGGTTPEVGKPYAIPTIYNATYVGGGTGGTGSENQAMKFRDNSGGKYFNSIFTEFRGYAVSIETEAQTQTSQLRLAAGELVVRRNLFWNFNMGSTTSNDPAVILNEQPTRDALTSINSFGVDPFPNTAFNHGTAGGINPRPSAFAAGVTSNLEPYSGRFFTPVTFKGAFNPNPGSSLWTTGWTAINKKGYLVN